MSKRKHRGCTKEELLILSLVNDPDPPKKTVNLKGILKKPSPPSRFLAPTSLSQTKLDFDAGTRKSSGDGTTAPPSKKRRLKSASEAKDTPAKSKPSKTRLPTPPEDHEVIIIDSSPDKAEPPRTSRKESSSQYKIGDDVMESFITDSQKKLPAVDPTPFLMSGALDTGDVPPKEPTRKTRPSERNSKTKPSERKSKTKSSERTSTLRNQVQTDVVIVPSSGAQPTDMTKQVQSEQNGPIASHDEGASSVQVEQSGPNTPEQPDASVPQCEQSPRTEAQPEAVVPQAQPEAALPSPNDATSPLVPSSLVIQEATSSPLMAHPAQKTNSGLLTPTSLAQNAKRSSPDITDVTNILTQYELTRETEIADLKRQLKTSQAQAANLNTQLTLLKHEFATQSKHRKVQASWLLNRFVIFSRRTYALRPKESINIVEGCDDLEQANAMAKGTFMGEMEKLGFGVMDLGRVDAFEEMGKDVAVWQTRVTGCGMLKCRAYDGEGRWDLTVERVASA